MPSVRAQAVAACDYNEDGRRCRESGIYGVQFDGKPVRLCDRHSRPEFHPPDLHKKLPGRVKRALRGGS